MKLTFRIEYFTGPDEGIGIMGSLPELGTNDTSGLVKMKLITHGMWEFTFELKSTTEPFSYKYVLLRESQVLREFGPSRVFKKQGNRENYELLDSWRPARAHQNAWYSAPFMKAFFKRIPERNKETDLVDMRLQLRCSRIHRDYQLGIIGNCSALGNWKENEVALMNDEFFPVWQVDIARPPQSFIEYKYVIYSKKEKRIVTWEQGENRILNYSDKDLSFLVRTDEFFRFPVGEWKGAGLAIPVFSIRARNGAGVGDFSMIKKLADWASDVGLKIIQVLPVNDTVATHTWTDSYPYSAISVHALHPIYANISEIGKLRDKKAQSHIDKEAKRLDALQELDYQAVMNLKSRFFKLSYDENKGEFLKSPAFQAFLEKEKEWLVPYAAFSCLRDRYQTPDFHHWDQFKKITNDQLIAFTSEDNPDYDDVAVHYYIQFHLDKQLRDASEYAREKGVVLKGDLPIGIYRHSVDAWMNPELFDLDSQAGAPPDYFSTSGQNWGFPTYKWEEMAKNNYHWWCSRMTKMEEYFDVFRIDHILGFFRIWEIPWVYVQGTLGHFNPAIPVTRADMESLFFPFDEDRFCAPFIPEQTLDEVFGQEKERTMRRFFRRRKDGRYAFKDPFDSQRKIHELNLDEQVKERLFLLHSEVLFTRKGTGPDTLYFPRIGMHATRSFQWLDWETKRKLDQFQNDYFFRRHDDFWKRKAMQKLPVLKEATDMLICGEDLGMVPDCVPGVMDDLGILSLAVQRMPNHHAEFWHPHETPYLSVTTTGSHDVSVLRAWWEEDEGRRQRFYTYILGRSGPAPATCEGWLAKEIIRQHMESPSMLAIFPIQDLVAMRKELCVADSKSEQINHPGIVPHYWKWRFHLNVEDLQENESFNNELREMVDGGGRYADY